MNFGGDDQALRRAGQIVALWQWSLDHHYLLLLVENTTYAEQTLYRLGELVKIVQTLYA